MEIPNTLNIIKDKYIKMKSEVINKYIIEDEEEPLDFDPLNNQIIKRNSLKLSKFK